MFWRGSVKRNGLKFLSLYPTTILNVTGDRKIFLIVSVRDSPSLPGVPITVLYVKSGGRGDPIIHVHREQATKH